MSKSVNNKNRIDYFDILRGIGITLMVMGHVSFGEGFSKYIHAFHMPLFFFIAGYFYRSDKYESEWKYIVYEAKTLLIPYVVFVTICQPLHYIYTHEFEFTYYIKSLISSNHNRVDVAGAYWFLLCLFVAKIIFFVLEQRFEKKTFAILCIGLSICGNFLPFELPLCADSALSCLAIIYAGYFLKINRSNMRVHAIFNMSAWKIVVLLVVNTISIYLNGMVNIRTNDYSFVPLFWINCIMAIILWLNISIRIDKAQLKFMMKISGCLKYIGRNSIVYLLLNEIVIYLVTTVLAFIKINTIWYQLERVIVSIGTMIVLTIASEIFNRTKLKILLGKF